MTLLRDKRGSITVFLVIIFTAFLVLTGLLIDAVRILLAQQQLKGALDSAVRSTMADCHKGMAAEYGIYGGVLQKNKIAGFLAANLKEQQGAFNIIKYDNILVETADNPTDNLLNDAVFQDQILHYMKYKGPLVLGENLISKLNGHNLNKRFAVMEFGQKAVSLGNDLNIQCQEFNQRTKTLQTFYIDKDKDAILRVTDNLLFELNSLQQEIETAVIPAINEYEAAVHNFRAEDGRPDKGLIEESYSIKASLIKYQRDIKSNIETIHRIKQLSGNNSKNKDASLLESELKQLRNSLGGLEEITMPISYEKPDIDIDRITNKKITEFISENLILNVLSEEDVIPSQEFDSADNLNLYNDWEEGFIEDEGQKVMSCLTSLKQELEKLISKSGDRLFQTEYVMDKYTYLTSSTMREHYFKKGEIEYILCGNNSEMKNLLAIFQRIWFLRFAVNVLECFYKCNIPQPMARLAYALAEGFKQACSETAHIYNGKGVPLFPDLPNLQMYYSDYLRMFLLLQENDIQLNRMRQLIQVNIRRENDEGEFEMADYLSKGKVRARAEIDLWFLPARAFSKWTIDNIQNGKLIIEKETVFSY